jgi:hypothetical protein
MGKSKMRKPLTEEQKKAAREYAKAWKLAHPLTEEQKAIAKERNRKYVENNREKVKQRRKKYREAHSEQINIKVAESHKRWNEAHPEEAAARRKKYREEYPEIVKRSNSNWYFSNGGKEKSRMRQVKFYSVPANRIHKSLIGARKRANKKGVEFEEALFDTLPFNAPSHCICCGNELSYELSEMAPKRTRKDPRPSLDRIDNSIGYTVANTRVICFKCNCFKADASFVDIANLYAYVNSVVSSTVDPVTPTSIFPDSSEGLIHGSPC